MLFTERTRPKHHLIAASEDAWLRVNIAGWPRSGAASLFLAELALDRAISLRHEAAQQAVPARARRPKRRRPGFQARSTRSSKRTQPGYVSVCFPPAQCEA